MLKLFIYYIWLCCGVSAELFYLKADNMASTLRRLFSLFIVLAGIAIFSATAYADEIEFSDLQTTGEGSASLTLSWSGSEAKYRISYYEEGQSATIVDNVPTNFWYLNGLHANARYYFTIQDKDGNPLTSEISTFTLAAPVSASLNTATNVFQWTDSANYPASAYRLTYSKKSDLSDATVVDNIVEKNSGTISLDYNTMYYYKVEPRNGAGVYNEDGEVVPVGNTMTLPYKLQNFAVSDRDPVSVSLTWDISPIEKERGIHYIIEASTDDFASIFSYKQVATTETGTTITALLPNKEYKFRARAVNSEGGYSVSDIIEGVWTLSPNINTGGDSLSFDTTWGSITANILTPLSLQDCAKYRLEVSTDGFTSKHDTTVDNSDAGTISITVGGLPYTTQFAVRIITINEHDDENITDLDPITTGNVGAPENIDIVEIGTTSFTVQFDSKSPAPTYYSLRVKEYGGEFETKYSSPNITPKYNLPDYTERIVVPSGSLEENKEYCVEVDAIYGSEVQTANACTDPDPQKNKHHYTLPKTVEDFAVGQVWYSSMSVTFTDPNDPTANFILEVSPYSNFSSETITVPCSGSEGKCDTPSSLLPNEQYFIRGAIVNEEGNGTALETSTITLALPPVLDSSISTTADTIFATFSPGGNPEHTRFRIECSTYTDFSYIREDTAGLNEKEIEDTVSTFTLVCSNLYTSTEYNVRVVPINKGSVESPHPLMLGTASTLSPKPDAYDEYTGHYTMTDSTITVAWPMTYSGTPYPDSTRYRIKMFNSEEDCSSGDNVLGSTITTGGTAVFGGLASNKTYYFSLAVCHSDNPMTVCDDDSQSKTVSMPSAITDPSVPVLGDIIFSDVGLNNYTLNWQYGNNAEGTSFEVYTSSVCIEDLVDHAIEHCHNTPQGCVDGWDDFVSECYVSSGTAIGTSHKFGDLFHGEEYAAIIRTQSRRDASLVTDFIVAGSTVTMASSGEQILERSRDNEISVPTDYGDISLFVPAYSLSVPIAVNMIPMFDKDFDEYSKAKNVGGMRLSATGVGIGINPTEFYKTTVYDISRPLYITLYYRDHDLDIKPVIYSNPGYSAVARYPMGATSPIDSDIRQKLVLAYYDEISKTWNPVDSESITDTSTGIDRYAIKAKIWKLGTYQIMQPYQVADAGKVLIYPNPYKPSTNGGYVNFANLPDMGNGCKIKIYTFLGELVQEIRSVGSSTSWDGRNKAGKNVASGIYIVYIQSNDDKSVNKIFKLAIER